MLKRILAYTINELYFVDWLCLIELSVHLVSCWINNQISQLMYILVLVYYKFAPLLDVHNQLL